MEPLVVANWRSLESNGHRPEAQEHIRRAIRAGLIRVVPTPAGDIRIVENLGEPAPAPDPAILKLLHEVLASG